MIVSLEGRMGQGKTAAITALGILEYKRTGCKLFATYHLNDVIYCPSCGMKHAVHKFEGQEFYQCEKDVHPVNGTSEIERIPYTYLTVEDFYNIFKEVDQGERILGNCLFLLDEAYLFMDSRTSGSKMNRLFNSFAMQTRKRGVDMYITTHEVKRLDQRIRAAIDLRVSCRFRPATRVVTLRIRDMHTGDRTRQSFYGPVAAFPYFDTNELVRPPGKLYKMSKEDLG